jgi:two-component system chemotaxis response regulator CheY
MFDPKTKILIVDDMFTMRKIVSKVFKDLGFSDLVDAADGNEAWEKISASSIQLVVSDWNMPNCTGLDLLKKVRASEQHKNLPFVLLTAEAEGHQVMEALKAGVDNYIIKPFTPNTFKAKLEETFTKVSNRS